MFVYADPRGGSRQKVLFLLYCSEQQLAFRRTARLATNRGDSCRRATCDLINVGLHWNYSKVGLPRFAVLFSCLWTLEAGIK